MVNQVCLLSMRMPRNLASSLRPFRRGMAAKLSDIARGLYGMGDRRLRPRVCGNTVLIFDQWVRNQGSARPCRRLMQPRLVGPPPALERRDLSLVTQDERGVVEPLDQQLPIEGTELERPRV
jgi:hypothetical protein